MIAGPADNDALDVIAGFIAAESQFYGFYDAVNQASNYSKRLKRQIFGKKAPSVGFSPYLLRDNAGIFSTYSFN